MNFKMYLALLRTPHVLTSLRIFRDIDIMVRSFFLHAAFETGLLPALRTPATFDQIVSETGARRRELLEPLVQLGVALKELAESGGVYRLRGKRAKALADPGGDPLAAVLQECVGYHGPVFTHLAERIKGAPLGNYLADTGELIARSSRMFEPFTAEFARSVVRANRPLRLLEIGCGSGVYLRHAAEANPRATGVGIDMQVAVVVKAKANLASWGIRDRFDVHLADILSLPDNLRGPFDLVTLYNNVYYFPSETRTDLFRTIRSLLGDSGSFALVSSMNKNTAQTLYFDIVLRSTTGCAPLPEMRELKSQLHGAGYKSVTPVPLVPGGWYCGVVAKA